jgi:lysophospholipase L1-like esterase
MRVKLDHLKLLWVVAIFALVVLPIYGCNQQAVRLSPEVRYGTAIETFLQQDQLTPPPKQAILFIGSSIFRQWTHLTEQMAPLPVFNRAFGGSRTEDVLCFMDKVVLPYSPRIIVYYCGSNDINAGERPTAIFGRTKAFCDRVHSELPDTRIFYVSINKAPQKQDRWDVVDSTNAMVKQHCSMVTYMEYVDVNPVLFDGEGKPRMELYKPDRLHFEDEAYVEFTRVIKPILERAWSNR